MLAALAFAALIPASFVPTPGADPAAPLRAAVSAAEASLREGEPERAESHYRDALLEGWLLLGAMETADGHASQARQALGRASTVAVDTERARRALALVEDRRGEAADPAPSPLQEAALRHEVTTALARAYVNLGVMQAQARHFDRAAELFEAAAGVDADFPQVQYSLGVARFNAGQYEKAAGPLARALAASPENGGLRSMVAVAWFNAGAYGKTVDLLRDDPGRLTDPSLQYTYGLALVRSDHAAEAERVFSRLLREHGDSAELLVVLGEAHAQEGNYDAAIASLQGALRLKPDVAEAGATLGVIFLKQGRLPEAEGALRAELSTRPGDVQSLNALATVLELEGRPEEALPLLRSSLRVKPDFANARYLLGKILLSQGSAAEALEHLSAAAQLAPEDANTRYQLAQAYQRLGRPELAQEQFEIFRQLKDKRRGSAP